MQKTFVAWLDDSTDGEVSVFLVRAETRDDAVNKLRSYFSEEYSESYIEDVSSVDEIPNVSITGTDEEIIKL